MKYLKFIRIWIRITLKIKEYSPSNEMKGFIESNEKSNKEIFMEDYGFCHSCNQLCPVIPAKEAMYPDDLEMFFLNENQEVPTSVKIQCIECKMDIQNHLLLFLSGAIIKILQI